MGNTKEFKYKIDLELAAKDFSPELAKKFKAIQNQADNNKIALSFSGDYKDLIKQLADLQKMIPNVDITKGIEFHLADEIREDSELGKKLLNNLTTHVINSVRDMVTSIEGIKDTISETEKSLEDLKNRRKELYDGKEITNAAQAYAKVEERLITASAKLQNPKSQPKTRLKAIEDMRAAYQDMVNLETEAGKKASESQTLKNMAKTVNEQYKIGENNFIKLGKLRDDLLNTKATHNSYSEMLGAIDNQILETENRLSGLKKDLETAENPELQVKGKLTDNFIEDLQSQLDALTGIEVKVRPKIDKDVKLEVEVEGDVKPAVQPDKKIELPKPAEEIDLGKYDLSKIEVINEKLSEYKSEAESISESAQKAVDELNKFTGKSYTLDRNMHDIPSTLRAWNEASMSANDFKKEIKAAIEANEKEKAAILYENLKTFYPKTTTTLDTFKDKDFKYNYDSYLSRGKTKVQALQLDPDLQRYRVLEDAIHQLEIKQGGLVRETAKANAELEKQAKISSELSKYDTSTKNSRNSAIQSLDQQIAQKETEMANMLKLDKDFQDDYHKLARARTNHESTEEYGQLLEKYNIPKGSGLLQSVKYLANQRGELQETIDILKGVRQAISESNEAVSAPPNTSGMNEVEKELHEEAAAHRENEEAAKADAKAQEQFGTQKNIRKPHDEYRDNQIKFLQEYKKAYEEYDALEYKNTEEGLTSKEESRLDKLREKIKEYDEILKQYSDIRVQLKNGESYSIINDIDPSDWNTKKSDIKDIVFELKEADQQVAEFKERLGELSFPNKRPSDSVLDNYIVYIKKGTMEVDEAIQGIKDAFGALGESDAGQNNIQDELHETAEETKKVEEEFNNFEEKLEYLKSIKKESKFLETADEKRMDMEEKAWDVGGNNPKSEADSQNKIKQYEDLCDHIEVANEAIDTFNDKYEKVIVTLKNGERIELFDAIDLDDLSLAKKNIQDIEFVLNKLDESQQDVQSQNPEQGFVDTTASINAETEALEREEQQARETAEAKEAATKVGSESSTSSQLEKELGLRQENVKTTDAQIEAELRRQSVASNTKPDLVPEDLTNNLDKVINKFKELGVSLPDIRKLLQGDSVSLSWIGKTGDQQENIARLIELLKQLGLEIKTVENAEGFNTTITARTAAQAEAFEQEKQKAEEAAEAVEKLNVNLDTLANHPYPTDDKFINQKIAAEQSIWKLDDMLPEDYQGEVRQQITDLHTELNKLTEDDGLSNWREKFKIVAESVKDVRNEVDALAKNQKKEMTSAVADANFSKNLAKAKNDLEEMSSSMSKLGITKFDEAFKNLDEQLNNVGNDSDKLKIVRARIDELKISLREAVEDAKGLAENQKKTYDSLISMINKRAELQVQNIRNEQNGMENSKTYKDNADEIDALNRKIAAVDKLKLSEDQLKSVEEALSDADKKVQQAEDMRAAAIKRTEEAGKTSQQQIDSTRASLQKQAATLTNNGKLMKVYGDQVKAYLEEINNPTTTIDRLEQIRIELNKISAEATVAGQSGKSFFQILKQRAQSLVAYLSTFASFYRVVGFVKESIGTIRELDTELVDLRKTTVMSTSELNQFYLSANDVAKELGVTTKEVITQAAAWSRLGYNTKEAATEMARMSSKFAVISPGMDTSTAQEGLVSVMKAWDIDVADVESQIMDKINILGNNFAESNLDIIQGMERSAAALSAVGTTYTDAFALFTGGQEILQNAEKMGTALRSISMRIRGEQLMPPYSENYMLCA